MVSTYNNEQRFSSVYFNGSDDLYALKESEHRLL